MCNCSSLTFSSLNPQPKTMFHMWLSIVEAIWLVMLMAPLIILIFVIIYKELTGHYVNIKPYAKRRLPPPGIFLKVINFIIDNFISYVIVLMFISVFISLFVCSDFRYEARRYLIKIYF
jgi:hypothetical protein